MAKPKLKKKQPDEDEVQSLRFMEEAARVAADGGLNPIEAEGAFEAAFAKAALKKRLATNQLHKVGHRTPL